MDPTTSKSAMRRQMRARRRALSAEERVRASETICRKLIGDGAFASAAGALAVYLASPEEIDLAEFIREMLVRGVTVVSPRWNGEAYELAKVKSLERGCLRLGPMNILEPDEPDVVEPRAIGVWIVPGLAFTRGGRRLGYGGGWYDRLLAASAEGSLKVGVAHEFQIVEDIPTEPHDIPMDRIVTDAASA